MEYTDLQFLNENGDEELAEDETIKNLVFTCEEGVDYSYLDVTTSEE